MSHQGFEPQPSVPVITTLLPLQWPPQTDSVAWHTSWSPGFPHQHTGHPSHKKVPSLAQQRLVDQLRAGGTEAPTPSLGLTSSPSGTGEGCRLRLWDQVRLAAMLAWLGQSLTLASLAWCSNPRSAGHGWLATGLLVEGRRRPGPGNHTSPDLLISPDLGRLSPSSRRGARDRSCGLGRRVDGKKKRPHFIKEGRGWPKPPALSPSAAHPRAVSSWKPRDTTRRTLRKYPLSLGKHHTLKIAPSRGAAAGTAQGQAGPGHTPVRVPASSCWDGQWSSLSI